MGQYTKTITAMLTSMVGMAAVLGLDPESIGVTTEVIAGAAVALNAILVWWLPNK
jgi:hypothetical protein